MAIHALIESIVLDRPALTEETLRIRSGGFTLEVLWNPKGIIQATVSEVVRGNFREMLRFIGSSALARVEHEAKGYRRSDPAIGRALIGMVRKAKAQMGQTTEGLVEARQKTIKIPKTAFSVIETDVLDVIKDPAAYGLSTGERRRYKLLKRLLKGDRLQVPTDPTDLKDLHTLLTHLSNSYDAQAYEGLGIEDKRFARQASQALSTLSSKIPWG